MRGPAKSQLQESDKLGKITQLITPFLGLSFPCVKMRELKQFLQGQIQLCHFIILTCIGSFIPIQQTFLNHLDVGDKMMSKQQFLLLKSSPLGKRKTSSSYVYIRYANGCMNTILYADEGDSHSTWRGVRTME